MGGIEGMKGRRIKYYLFPIPQVFKHLYKSPSQGDRTRSRMRSSARKNKDTC